MSNNDATPPSCQVAGRDSRRLRGRAGESGRAEGRELVSSPIFHHGEKITFELYPRSIRAKRPFKGDLPVPPSRAGSTIDGFSAKSRGRLRFTAANSAHLLTAQFCCTYHNVWPIDGRQFKRDLDRFLVAAKRAFPFLCYLWIGEFQTRGAPHAHVYLNVPVTDDARNTLARIWCRIADRQTGRDPEMWNFHLHWKNLIRWKMGTGSYLCKYLDKEAQKAIPEGFRNFGRWWGHSRGLVEPPELVTSDQISEEFPQLDETTGELHDAMAYLVRVVGRYHEKVNRRSWWRRTSKTSLALTGAPIFRQTVSYLRRCRGIEDEKAPF